MTLYTIGHSTLDLPAFIHRLHAHGVTHIADVRSMPGSNRHPQFNSEDLSRSLWSVGIGYRHFPELGGRRSSKVITPEIESMVAGWTHGSFRSYAAWTFTAAFERGLADLYRSTSDENDRVALMCSEAVPWRCHRSILAAVLVARGEFVTHIMGAGSVRPHILGEWGPRPVIGSRRALVGAEPCVTWPGDA